MKIPLSAINTLISRAPHLKHPSYLFSFDYNKLSFRFVYLATISTLLITTRGKNTISWNTYIDQNTGYIDTFIPEDCLKELAYYVLKNNRTQNFFQKVQDKLISISENENMLSSSNDEIISIMKTCKTKDSRVYEGERPFYDHYRRKSPSKENLEKIKRIMGVSMHNFCLKHEILISWKDSPQPNSLDYLDPNKLQQYILKNINNSL